METTSDATKILEKGPDYLRKQMELESDTKGHMSAVERLAASKTKYVKSQVVANSTQEPVISLGSSSVCSTSSSCRSSQHGGKLEQTGAAETCSPGQVRRSSSKKRPDSLLLYRQKCDLLRGSAHDRKHHITRKLRRSSPNKSIPLPEATEAECESGDNKEKICVPEGTAKECSSHVAASQSETKTLGGTDQHSKSSETETKLKVDAVDGFSNQLKVPEIIRRPGKGVSRSHSDISSRYSKSFADFDSFFKYCGLESKVIESLGKENFSACSDEIERNIRSVSVSTSDGGFSRNSSESDGLLENELHKKKRQGTSVIERNARIIKWLYSCKNAKETGRKLRDLD